MILLKYRGAFKVFQLLNMDCFTWCPHKRSTNLQRPMGESACSWQMATVVVADSIKLTPAAKAKLVLPACMSEWAKLAATKEEEHAVSVLRQGPWRPKRYATLQNEYSGMMIQQYFWRLILCHINLKPSTCAHRLSYQKLMCRFARSCMQWHEDSMGEEAFIAYKWRVLSSWRRQKWSRQNSTYTALVQALYLHLACQFIKI